MGIEPELRVGPTEVVLVLIGLLISPLVRTNLNHRCFQSTEAGEGCMSSLIHAGDREAPRFQVTCPSQWLNWSPLGGKTEEGLARRGPPSPAGSVPSLHPPQQWPSTEGSSSLDSDEHVLLWKDHRGVGVPVVSRSSLHWPCILGQIIESQPQSTASNFGIASAGASEPGQLMKAGPWNSDSVGLGWP